MFKILNYIDYNYFQEELAAGHLSTSDAAIGPAPQIKLIEPSPAPTPMLTPEPPPPVAQPSAPTELPPLESNDTSAQDFYKWLTDSNEGNMEHAENVLFRGNAPVQEQ